MKIRTIISATALVGAGAVGLVSESASAGCGATITVDNDHSRSVTVDWDASEVRSWQFGFAGNWASIDSGSTTLTASEPTDEASRAVELDFSCSLARQYRLRVSDGSSSWWEYHNETGPGGTWTTDITPFIDVEY